MGTPLGFKTFTTGDVLTAADTNGYLMQGVWTFASATARDAAVTSPQEGNMCYLKDTDAVQYYSGSAWTAVGGTPSFVGALAKNNASVAFTANTNRSIPLSSADVYDTTNFHDPVTNNTRVTIPTGKTGYYMISGLFSPSAGISSYAYMSFFKNGATLYDAQSVKNLATNNFFISTSIPAYLTAGDYVEMYCQVSDTVTTNVLAYLGVSYMGA